VIDLWRTLYASGADLVINGHDHERFAPQEPEGNSDPIRGIWQLWLVPEEENCGLYPAFTNQTVSGDRKHLWFDQTGSKSNQLFMDFLPVAAQQLTAGVETATNNR
jgi:hypothetical protein